MFLTTWHTTISPTLEAWGLYIPIWLAALSGIAIVIAAGFLEWKYSMPSYYKSQNTLVYKKDNPAMKALEEIKIELEEIKKSIQENKKLD
jgi:hypothetical protein